MPIPEAPVERQWSGDSQSGTVAQDVQRQDGVEENDSYPWSFICSQPKNRTAPTTSVHLVPATRLISFQNEMYLLKF